MSRHAHYAKWFVDVIDCEDLHDLAGEHGAMPWALWPHLTLLHKLHADGRGWIREYTCRRLQRDLSLSDDVFPTMAAFHLRGMIEVDGDLNSRFDFRVPRALELQTLTPAQKQARYRDNNPQPVDNPVHNHPGPVTETGNSVTKTGNKLPKLKSVRVEESNKQSPRPRTPAHAPARSDAFISKAIAGTYRHPKQEWSDAILDELAERMHASIDPDDPPKSVRYWTAPSPYSRLSRIQEHMNTILEANAQASAQEAKDKAQAQVDKHGWPKDLLRRIRDH